MSAWFPHGAVVKTKLGIFSNPTVLSRCKGHCGFPSLGLRSGGKGVVAVGWGGDREPVRLPPLAVAVPTSLLAGQAHEANGGAVGLEVTQL